MKYKLTFLIVFLASLFSSCSDDSEEIYQTIPVNVDLSQVPYQKLSTYNFFVGNLNNQIPNSEVLPYEPKSALFTDYASKKRFIWMPENSQATYNSDFNVLELPVGSVLIKNFYYENLQPNNITKIIETRVMIKKSTGWIFAEYVWNEDQTEAYLNMNGSNQVLNWKKNNNEIITIDYRIPNELECFTCHNIYQENVPIGVKPQNLNFNLNFSDGNKNQLQKWVEKGFLADNLPQNITSIVDYNDTTQPIDLRFRSYVDSNCSHCHQQDGHASMLPLRLKFNETTNITNLGVCVTPSENFDPNYTNIITPQKTNRSMMYFRITTNDNVYRMPMLGRSIIHDEGVALLEEYINSLEACQ